jgi:uncharacterized protein (TIGR02996 family)
MSDREAFLNAIAANPADDTARLAFADWLDEHDDPVRAEFIRVQIELGYADRKDSQHAELAAREKELLDAHRAQWLGPLETVQGEGDYEAFEPTFRRGFVESASIHGRALIEHADAVRQYCPALVELDVVGVRGHGEGVAAAECLNTVRTLRLEDWPNPADAQAIANSPHLSRLESLSFWLGSRNDDAVYDALRTSSKTTPAVRRVELIQLRGGMTAGAAGAGFANVVEPHNRELLQGMSAGPLAELLAVHADGAAALVNSFRRAPVATVIRPFDVLFPLAGDVGRGLFAGTLPDDRPVLACGGRECELLYFDAAGRLTGGERLDLSAVLVRPPRYNYIGYNEAELVERLGERVGFQLGAIWVREFDAATVFPGHWLSVYKFGNSERGLFENPDEPELPEGWPWEDALEHVRFFLRSSNFCITAMNECWADDRGHIHST